MNIENLISKILSEPIDCCLRDTEGVIPRIVEKLKANMYNKGFDKNYPSYYVSNHLKTDVNVVVYEIFSMMLTNYLLYEYISSDLSKNRS
jgi:hypothetical protein